MSPFRETRAAIFIFSPLLLALTGCSTKQSIVSVPQTSDRRIEAARSPMGALPETNLLAVPERFRTKVAGDISIQIVGEIHCAGEYFVPAGSTLQSLIAQQNTSKSPVRLGRLTTKVSVIRREPCEGQTRSENLKIDVISKKDAIPLRDGDRLFFQPNCWGL